MVCEPEKDLIFAKVGGPGFTRDCFYQADHQLIFDVLGHLYDRGSAIDSVLIIEELKRLQLLEEVGGVAYLANC